MMAFSARIAQRALAGRYLFLLCLWCGVVAAPACRSLEASPGQRHVIAADSEWKEWDVLDTKRGLPVQLDRWIESLSGYDIVYVGEEHHNHSHIEAALKILRSLVDRGRHPTLALEMFGWDGQEALNRYAGGGYDQADRTAFVTQSRWTQNWGGSLEDYAPLLDFAREHHLIVRAMNPPKSLIRSVVKKGIAGVRGEPEWSRWGLDRETIVDDPLYREKILEQLQQCHGGGAPEDYETMYQASMVRDEAMAKTLAEAWESTREDGTTRGPIVSYTGGGHIQYKLPVPKRVARRLADHVKQITVYLTSFDPARKAEISESMNEGIADYVWLTPLGPQGPPRRCR
ncbi:MAG TPA: ChaN family lipoprotein [Nitrospiraceae bacterium]|nr:ChaN family lipoprotein [Nitrospiraceae bacterium]